MTLVQARPASSGPLAEQKLDAFLADIEPFFTGRPVIYVDVGAYRGETFRAVWRSPLRPKRAYLVEPNPDSFARLQAMVKGLGAEAAATCYPLGLGAAPGEARFRADATMTRVIGPGIGLGAGTGIGPGAGTDPGPAEPEVFSAGISTLDSLAADFLAGRISLLKIDVEGFELQVLAGAEGLLRAGAVDMIYIEAGLNPEGGQQTYYREIEDRLAGLGYRLFRIYEQTHEWIVDSPLLRRVNLAFMSAAFADSHPFRLSRELFARRQAQAALEAELAGRDRALAEAKAGAAARNEAAARLEARLAAREAALAAACESLGTAEAALKAATRAAAESAAEARRRLRKAEAAAAAEAGRRHALERELAELKSYGRRLEARHLHLLESTSWRLLEPARRILRRLRRQAPPPRFAPRLGPLPSRSRYPR